MQIKSVVFSIALLISAIICRAQWVEHIIYPAIGMDSFYIDKSTLEDIVRTYGPNYRVDTVYESLLGDLTQKKYVYALAIIYKKQGLSFYIGPSSDVLVGISVYKPARAKTNKGIILNRSTFQDVINIYGPGEWYFGNGYILKRYDEGIKFKCRYSNTLPTSARKLAPYLSKSVTEIEIHAQTKMLDR